MIHPLGDFFIYYIGSWIFAGGGYPYGISERFIIAKHQFGLNFDWATGFSYPPLSLIFFVSFTKLPPWVAGGLWTGLSILAYALYIRRKIFRTKEKKITLWLLLTYLPVWGTLLMGQINIFVLWLIEGYLALRKQPVGAIFLAAAGQIKVYPLVMILSDLKNKKMLLLTGLFSLAMILPFGKLGGDYFRHVLEWLQADTVTYFHIQSWHGYLARLGINNMFVEYLPAVIVAGYIYWRANKPLVWLVYGSIFSGLNSFANFTLAIPAMLYLVEKRVELSARNKKLFYISLVITNLLFPISIWAERSIIPHDIASRLIYANLSSLGFFAIVIQLYLMIRVVEKAFGKLESKEINKKDGN